MTDAERLAALDVGSNTIRLLVADFVNGQVHAVRDESEFTRLGKGVDSSGRLDPVRMDRAVDAVQQMARTAADLGASRMRAVATSAVRDAVNGTELVHRMRDQTGVDVEVVSGEEEARLTARGALLGISGVHRAIVCDLGGGSAEIVAMDGAICSWGRSLKMGSGRLTERFVSADPPEPEGLRAVRNEVVRLLSTLPPFAAEALVLTGGTATAVARLAGVEGQIAAVTRDDLTRVVDITSGLHRQELVERYGVRPERADVLPAGTVALATVAEYYDVTRVLITLHGIREGIILDMEASAATT